MAFVPAALYRPGIIKGVSRRPRWVCTAIQPTTTIGESIDGGVTAADGFRATGVTAGLKPSGASDLAVVISDGSEPAVAAGVFTQSAVCAAPVQVTRSHLSITGGRARAVVLNSGQANAATGSGGHSDAISTAEVTSNLLGCSPSEVLLCSTGVIGVRPDVGLLTGALPNALSSATSSDTGGDAAARAIMTTDLRSKQAARALDGLIVGGMCKGSGMIHPNMATMLGVLTCNAAITPERWEYLVRKAADVSFNCITVDGDTSTNDTILALTSDRVEAPEALVSSLLDATMRDLARQIARDGEGATVLLEVRVSGASSDEDARVIARTVASSSLVKAAVHGRDPNWGRVAAAAGRAGVGFDQSELEISVGPHQLMRAGQPLAFDAAAASAYLSNKANAAPEHYCTRDDTVVFDVRVGDGPGQGTAYGCDLSYDYVRINAEYTT